LHYAIFNLQSPLLPILYPLFPTFLPLVVFQDFCYPKTSEK
jgi:hypothetical protein